MKCTPTSGALPFATRFTITLTNPADSYRVAAGRIDVITGDGERFANWRAGFTILSAGEIFQQTWLQSLPGSGSVLGHNWFDLRVSDVTQVPYNLPPYLPSGDEDIDCAPVQG